jgi:outer membrane protein insertion porin family
VFVNQFKPLDLRTSVGLTMKLLTPVGSLDFDFGVKLKRNIGPDNERESFGRFHLSIGYF